MIGTTLGDATTTWAHLTAGNVTGQGRVAPLLRFEVFARTTRELIQVQLHLLQARLVHSGETLGQGFVTGEYIGHSETSILVDVSLARAALTYIDEMAVGEYVELDLDLRGFVHACDSSANAHRFISSPQSGEWVFEGIGRARSTKLSYRIPRSEWFSRVLQPLGTTEYVSFELALPQGEPELRAAVSHLARDEANFSSTTMTLGSR